MSDAEVQPTAPTSPSEEQGLAAAKIFRAILAGEIRWAEARAQLEELFGDEVVRRAIVEESVPGESRD